MVDGRSGLFCILGETIESAFEDVLIVGLDGGGFFHLVRKELNGG